MDCGRTQSDKVSKMEAEEVLTGLMQGTLENSTTDRQMEIGCRHLTSIGKGGSHQLRGTRKVSRGEATSSHMSPPPPPSQTSQLGCSNPVAANTNTQGLNKDLLLKSQREHRPSLPHYVYFTMLKMRMSKLKKQNDKNYIEVMSYILF